MPRRRDKAFLSDILNACQNILEYSDGFDFQLFMKDKKTQDAVIRNIEVIGEAIKNISKGLKQKYPQIEWNQIAKTRIKLFIHIFESL